ncbi:hypothetical protein D9757_006140 [Collybiopsis confluens]|uniref:DNA helicase n=1 Tax=Collybiopsis confluens TaxID=2823264 RepID=A0A8H5HI05_9AGAR|nr:hypothetical protein D9757_006140 [Collybiopsis confluens]
MSPDGTQRGNRRVLWEDHMDRISSRSNMEAGKKGWRIEEKEREAKEIYDRHDDLVRQAFHMQHFRNMLTYDPAEAKQDNSAVFQNYKSHYDLLQSLSESASGPSRRTRQAQNDQRNLIPATLGSSPGASGSVSTPSRKGKSSVISDILATASKGKGKVTDPPLPEPSVLRSSKALGKRKAVDVTLDEETSSVQGRRTKGRRRTADGNGAQGLESNPYLDLASTINRAHSAHDNNGASEAEGRPAAQKRPPLLRFRGPQNQSADVPSLESERTRRKSSSLKVTLPAKRSRGSLPSQGSILPAYVPFKRKLDLSDTAGFISNESRNVRTPTHVEMEPRIQPPSPIKRVKLILRRPAPLISSPSHRPPNSIYNHSISDFLSSYTTDGFEEISSDILASRVHSQARLLERAQKLRAEGRLVEDPSILQRSTTEIANEQRTTKDLWDHCIQDAAEYLEAKSEETTGEEIAQQISKAVQAYWDVQAIKQEKLKAQQERRMRALAKATIKLVITEWKKAVFHLRNQERMRLEAEEVRQSQVHLDAILDQSGQILETQHGELSRVDHSRSQSRGSGISGWADNADQEGEEESDLDEDENSEVDGLGGSRENSLSADEEDPSSISNLLVDHDTRETVGAHTPSDSDHPPPTVQPDTCENHLDRRSLSPSAKGAQNLDGHSTPLYPPLDSTSSPSTQDVATPPNPSMADDLNVATVEVVDLTMLSDDDDLVLEPFSKEHPSNQFSKPEGPSEVEFVLDLSSQSTILAGADVGLQSIGGDAIDPTIFPVTQSAESSDEEETEEETEQVPAYLKPFAVTHVDWDPNSKLSPPVLLRGVLRPYQFSGLEWLSSLHSNNLNGILADEMGLGKTIQTIALLAHLACDRGIWGPHLIIVPTSVLLNWEMEFKKFLPGFRILTYHGNTKRRKELRQGWNDKHHFNVCITSYTLASRDAHIFKRKNWYYMVLDEAHMIKNFKSQRWNILLMFRSFRRLLLTGTPLQNNLTELWALLQFLMSGSNFANLKQFGEWFSNPLEKAIEMGNVHDDETIQRVSKLHTVLRPYLLRRLKRDVEKELPSKYEHLVFCSLSKRQRFLYDEFMARANTQEALRSGVYPKIANILMQLRKVCNHPDLFEVRPIVTSFAMDRSAIADYEIKELLVRRRLFVADDDYLDLDLLGLSFINRQNTSIFAGTCARDFTLAQPYPDPGPAPPKDTRTVDGFRRYSEWQRRASLVARWSHAAYLKGLRRAKLPIYSSETIALVQSVHKPILPFSHINARTAQYVDSVVPSVHKAVLSYEERSNKMKDTVDRFAVITPTVVARDVARFALAGLPPEILSNTPLSFDEALHRCAVKLSIAFPSPSLLQYDCGKLQRLTSLLREKKAGGHRVLLFTQMTKVLDILEIYLNFHGYLYLRLDGATSIEDRQYVTERFNKDEKIFCFIASSRSGGVGINLTGADTVVFYDSDFNPQMDRQCEDRAHRIGQIRDVHIYRFISEHTVEEAMLLKANQKRSLDDLVIQKGEFDWRSIFRFDSDEASASRGIDSGLLTKALGEFEDSEDALAARMAEREEVDLEGADEADFGLGAVGDEKYTSQSGSQDVVIQEEGQDAQDGEEEGGTTVEFMLDFVARVDPENFVSWRI